MSLLETLLAAAQTEVLQIYVRPFGQLSAVVALRLVCRCNSPDPEARVFRVAPDATAATTGTHPLGL